MGFKIESIDIMNSVASQLGDTATEGKTKVTDTSSDLTTLASLVSGGGVDTALNNINTNLQAVANEAITLLTQISEFITSQSASYTATETTTQSELSDVDSMLASLEV